MHTNRLLFLFSLILFSTSLYSEEFFNQESLNDYRTIGVIGDQGVDFKLENGVIELLFTGSFKLSDYFPEIKVNSMMSPAVKTYFEKV